MELRHLRYFVAVAELGSISQAATKLFMAQPPLSAQIRQLEEDVGASLLMRLPRGVQLTEAGQSFLEDARAILARAQLASARARERQSGQRSTLRLGLMPSVTQSILPGLLTRLHESSLDVRVEAREISPSSRQMQAVRNAEIDLGFVRPAGENLPPESVTYINDPYCLVVPLDSQFARHRGPISLKQIAREPLVGFSRHRESDFFDQTMALCDEAGFTPDVRHEAGQFISVLAMVSCGLGVAILPASCAMLSQEQVVFRKLQGSRQKSRLVMVHGGPHMQDEWGLQVVKVATLELVALDAAIRKKLAYP